MDADKQKALEAAGWQVGSADDFLAGAPMDADKMRDAFEAWAKPKGFNLARWVKVESDGQLTPTEYVDADTRAALEGYAAGRKAASPPTT